MSYGTIKTDTISVSCHGAGFSVEHGEGPVPQTTHLMTSNHLNPVIHFFQGVYSLSLWLNCNTSTQTLLITDCSTADVHFKSG